MKFLLDHCVPRPLANHLPTYDIQAAGQMGWALLTNGRLLAEAEAAGYDGLITVDKGFARQQNMAGRKIAVLLLDVRNARVEGLLPLIPRLQVAMDNIAPGSIIRIGHSAP